MTTNQIQNLTDSQVRDLLRELINQNKVIIPRYFVQSECEKGTATWDDLCRHYRDEHYVHTSIADLHTVVINHYFN